MSDFKRVLILGTGPTSIQLAVNFKNQFDCYVGVAGRKSVRSTSFFSALEQHNQQIQVGIQNKKHQLIKGEASFDQVFMGYETIQGEWDTIILSVTTDAYIEVMKQIEVTVLQRLSCIILISPTLGSNHLLKNFMSHYNSQAEIISFSTYYGDTRWADREPSNRVVTAGVKKKVYIGSTHKMSKRIEEVCENYAQLGVMLEVLETPFDAETRNISLYVHPPLFMNDFSLNAIFGDSNEKKYVYKVYPEGPITQYLIRDMLLQWKELMELLEKMNIKKLNLLQFMTDDNYPVRLESLARLDIENFVDLETIHQEYLLYIRYTSLLVDPFSKPDEEGRYFDFSAVPIKKIFINNSGKWDVPRMPEEDYYRIKIIQGIAKYMASDCSVIDKFVKAYEQKIEEVAQSCESDSLSKAFSVQSFEEDIQMICNEIEKRRKVSKEQISR